MATPHYGTIAGADEYHSERGNVEWAAATDPEKTAALVVASEWIDGKYRGSFPAYKTGERAQVREWPRNGGIDIYGYSIASDVVPDEIANATYEVAFRQITAPGSLSTDVTMGLNLKSARVEGAVAVEYAGGSTTFDYQLSIPAVDRILQPVLTGGVGLSKLVGGTYRV